MARSKRTSPDIDKAQARATALGSISPTLDLGNGLTLAGYQAKITAAAQKLTAYNTLLSTLDSLMNELEALEQEIKDLSERMLAAVAVKYGKDSNEYEMAGGTRKSERKRPPKKATKAAKP